MVEYVPRNPTEGGQVVPTTAIVAETLDPRWLVEIEVIAAG